MPPLGSRPVAPRRSIPPNLRGRECADRFQPIPVMPKSWRQAIPVAAHCRKQEAATRSGAASPGSITGTRRSLDQIAARPTSSACEMVAAGSAFHARTFAPCWGIFKDPAAGHALTLEQGYELGRPSLITLSLTVRSRRLAGAAISGDAVAVSEGTIET